MADLPRPARDRVRAMSLYLVCAVVLLGLLLALYAVFVGFDRLHAAPVTAVAVTADGRDLVVEYTGGAPGCGDPHDVTVRESDTAVEVRAVTVARRATRLGFACPSRAVPLLQTVRLAEPLGAREVRDRTRGGAEVPVTDLKDLLTAVR
ncbi:hypothetical protein [Georgenia thermotolerans]|uniref:Uncharacterized protein n=1 Tax=Georgenia thermotolerans TaxID=527326 RepID=A0A7J5UTC6_9MICO|nr:hypothetical protein [Georgenia thermotolerans]KAE8765532.1 hypothetical protein GB883_03140 [Georgenia thermotolerans]